MQHTRLDSSQDLLAVVAQCNLNVHHDQFGFSLCQISASKKRVTRSIAYCLQSTNQITNAICPHFTYFSHQNFPNFGTDMPHTAKLRSLFVSATNLSDQ